MHFSHHPHPALLSFAILLLISGCVLDAEEIKTVVADPITKKNLDSHLCGNNIPEGNEECDDGNTSNGDGCSADCKIEVNRNAPNYCGDGNTRDGEACDDGNNDDGDGCSANCKIEDGYECYFITAAAKCFKRCGDGVADVRDSGLGVPIEQCDDGNNDDGDGCSADCKIEDGYKCDNNYTDVDGELVLSDTIKLPVIFRNLEQETLEDLEKCITDTFQMPLWLSSVGIPKLMTANNTLGAKCDANVMYSDDPKVELFSRLYGRSIPTPETKKVFVEFSKQAKGTHKIDFAYYGSEYDPKFNNKVLKPFTTEFHVMFRHKKQFELGIVADDDMWAYIDDYWVTSLPGGHRILGARTEITFDQDNNEEFHQLSIFHVNRATQFLYGVMFPSTLIAPSVCSK